MDIKKKSGYETYFKESFAKYNSLEKEMRKKAGNLSFLRLLVFAAGVFISVIAAKNGGRYYCITAALVSAIVFIITVKKHTDIKEKADSFGRLAEVNKRYLMRIDGRWTDLKDEGKEFQNSEHDYSEDLNVFGRASLFQLINITNTYKGRKILAELLAGADKDAESIRKRQEAVQDILSIDEFMQIIESEGLAEEKLSEDPEKLFKYFEERKGPFHKKMERVPFLVLPSVTVASLIWYALVPPAGYVLPLCLITLQLIISLYGYLKIRPELALVYNYRNKIKIYYNLLKIIENTEFKSTLGQELKNKINTSGKLASAHIKSLNSLVEAVSIQYNPMLYFMLNTVLLWDFQCLFALNKWKESSGINLRRWLDAIGNIEALSSLGVISCINKNSCWPEVSDDGLIINAKDMGHPLISESKRVCNDFKFENSIGVITGSNMSGKTTFIRTAGINLVLAYAGGPVCAGSFSCSAMDILTSMKITDDLSNGISTFYAELLRIKKIIDHSKLKRKMIFLIDEIFRGTNSMDRITGAESVLRNLDREWIAGLISTHDFELCNMEKGSESRIKNYHFTEEYTDGGIYFDYKLKIGPSTTRNAKYLMRMVGIEIAGE